MPVSAALTRAQQEADVEQGFLRLRAVADEATDLGPRATEPSPA